MLTKEQIIEIVKIKNEGSTNRNIAEKFKVSEVTIGNALSRLKKMGVKVRIRNSSAIQEAAEELLKNQI